MHFNQNDKITKSGKWTDPFNIKQEKMDICSEVQ